VATGMYPAKTGIRSPGRYYVRGDDRALALLPDHCFSHALVHLGLIRHEANSASAVRSRALWSILDAAGIGVGLVRWPLTYPAPPLHGFVLTDRFYDVLGSLLELDDRAAYPSDALPIARRAFVEPPDPAEPLPVPDLAAPTPEAAAAVRDYAYARAMGDLRARWPVQVSALRYQGLDVAGHHYLQHTQPREFGGAGEEERRRGLQVIERYYAYIDGQIGRALGSLTPGDLLLVVSGFGMQPPNRAKQLLARVIGDPRSGTHERAPDGFLLAYGSAVQSGRRQRGSIVDVAPTVLYYLDLPVGRDMDGYARADLFRASFTAGRPVAFVPSHNR
jgi:Type I phosphodiesterase / nucleotide pyrophosphatase